LNYSGSANKMKIDGIVEMFCKSERNSVKYKTYIDNGDSKTFKGICDIQPYKNVIVEKKVCVGHVEKRMETKLRNLKKKMKGLGGKGNGKLTDKLIR